MASRTKLQAGGSALLDRWGTWANQRGESGAELRNLAQ